MIYLSWDVGITHLAYCMLDTGNDGGGDGGDGDDDDGGDGGDDDGDDGDGSGKQAPNGQKNHLCSINGNHFTIMDWKNINLTGVQEHQCYKCGKNAKFYFTNDGAVDAVDDNVEWVCGTHGKKCPNLRQFKPPNSNKISIDVLCRNLVDTLDTLPHLLNAHVVLIENQPSLINPKMKSIASTIYTYFLIRGIVDKVKNESNINIVRYISPCNKLKVSADIGEQGGLMIERVKNQPRIGGKKTNLDTDVQQKSSPPTKGEKYRLTKKLAVQYCKMIVEPDEKNYTFLCQNKKKDDLSDCLLQGIYYITKQ